MSDQSYLLRDNGLRCFVPPCFSWDVVELTTGTLTTASDVELDAVVGEGAEGEQLQQRLAEGPHHVKGHFVPYQVGGSGAIPAAEGVRFVVTQMIGPVSG
jgi:hypothetical protein